MKIILLRRKDSKSESRARLFVYLSNEAVELLLGLGSGMVGGGWMDEGGWSGRTAAVVSVRRCREPLSTCWGCIPYLATSRPITWHSWQPLLENRNCIRRIVTNVICILIETHGFYNLFSSNRKYFYDLLK